MILLVDDDITFLATYEKLLKLYHYEVIVCSSAEEAIAQFERHKDKITVIISDYFMPNMNGLTLIKHIEEQSPSLQKVLCTGYCVESVPSDITVMKKPFRIGQLLDVILHNESDIAREAHA